ncbi:MAG: hypothetical protein ACXWUL_09755 [Caldimonas sp.]
MISRRHRRVHAVLGLAVTIAALALPHGAAAQTPFVPGKSCQTVEHRQFDFWVGHWNVFVPSGKKAGENRIEVIADGCALLEQWSGGGGVTGKSLNIYDPHDRRWHQTWVDNSDTLLMLTGGFVGRSMVMSMTGPSPSDPKLTVQQRITWTPAADGTVRQLWESSSDDGRTWTVLFDGRYVRVP